MLAALTAHLDQPEPQTVPIHEPVSSTEQHEDTAALTEYSGVAFYNGHKETYYNLDMTYVVQAAHNNGIEGEYWIRDDGCKMLGDYIMVAAAYQTHPYGSLVETSLGTGIVVDTGAFAASYPNLIDIATDW